jgi:hypothetical protein
MLTEYQIAGLREAAPVSGGMGQDEIDPLPEKIHHGKVFLRVSAYPWGVEFDVCET